MKRDISVILPVKNGANTILTAIESMLNQTCGNFELLIINDGSTDHTMEVVKNINDHRIKVLDSPQPGIANALNHGIRQSTGTFIARMDADDISAPNRLQKQLEYLKVNPNIGVVSSLVSYQGDVDKQFGYYLYTQWINRLIDPTEIYHNRFVDSPLAHPSVMMRKTVLDKYGHYNLGPIPEDYELWLRLMEAGVRFGKVPESLLTWTDHPSRLSRTHEHYKEESFQRVKCRYFKKWLERKFDNQWPKIWIWGTGKKIYRFTGIFREFQIPIAGFIELSKKQIGHKKRNIIHFEKIQDLKNPFIVSMVSNRSGKLKIIEYLINNGFEEGENFYKLQ